MTEIQTKGENGDKCGQDDRMIRYGPGIMRAKQGGNVSYHKLHAWHHGNNITWRLWGIEKRQVDRHTDKHIRISTQTLIEYN